MHTEHKVIERKHARNMKKFLIGNEGDLYLNIEYFESRQHSTMKAYHLVKAVIVDDDNKSNTIRNFLNYYDL
jgi:hypothetical protein